MFFCLFGFFFCQAEDRVKFELTKAQLLAIRAVKKSLKAKPLAAFSEETSQSMHISRFCGFYCGV